MPPNNHAVLSASSSHRWLHCTPSARLELEFDSRTSEAVAEGSAAHALAEHKLKWALKLRSQRPTSPFEDDMPVTAEQKTLTKLARQLYRRYGADGKYILDDSRLIVCQSNAGSAELRELLPDAVINPLGDWTGGPNVDIGAVNRKLGSDMGDAVTGGGLHGKDLSKADVSVNIYAHLLAQQLGEPVEISCAIGDEEINGVPYAEIVRYAREYIKALGGFEKFAEWGLIR